jgi:hypothetical protein
LGPVGRGGGPGDQPAGARAGMRARFPSAHGRAVGKPHRADAHPPQAGAAFGCPSLWLLSLGQARESDSAAAEADETWRNHSRVQEKSSHSWTPAFGKKMKARAAEQAPLYVRAAAGMTARQPYSRNALGLQPCFAVRALRAQSPQ